MRISESDIAFQSSRSFVEKHEKGAKLELWIDGRMPGAIGEPSGGLAPDSVALSAEGLARLRDARDDFEVYRKRQKDFDGIEGADANLLIKKILIELLTGRKIQVLDASKLNKDAEEIRSKAGDLNKENPDNIAPPDGKEGWGMVYTGHEARTEEEETVFSARGRIKTLDGEDTGFTLDLKMKRVTISSSDLTLRAGDAKRVDPLVINFGGRTAELTSARFGFDLNSDGTNEGVPFAAEGSGFLAIDLNNDGVINNGGELFGPSTGSGMSELSAYDSDKNSWIDETDPVFSRLRVWIKDPSGKDTLAALKDKGVGAIYLGYDKTDFQIMDTQGGPQGFVSTTGIYLKEDGTPGVVQQIDLAV
ncbi:MAG: VCBS repeat-containing protein [Deltaproteobacteria bacterium]|nr:VCBS repeat-containing protein [Deltaproteobacteria bacterium]